MSVIVTVAPTIFAICLYYKNQKQENNKYRNNNLPVITIWSPCDVTQYACDNDITNEYNDPNGARLFKVGNFSKTSAWDVVIWFSDTQEWEQSHKLYLQEVPNIKNQQWQCIYSRFHIDPNTKETSHADYKICDTLKNCVCDTRNPCVKDLFIHCEYYSSPDASIAIQINSVFKVKLECVVLPDHTEVKIKSIVRLNYITTKN